LLHSATTNKIHDRGNCIEFSESDVEADDKSEMPVLKRVKLDTDVDFD